MKVRDVMKKDVPTCSTDATLSDAARAMWDGHCGFVPIVDRDQDRVVGAVTDRDTCMAAWTQGLVLKEIPASMPMSTDLHCCSPDDSLEKALESMRSHRVKRLLVTDDDHRLFGVISLAALAKVASHGKTKSAQATKSLVAETLAAFAEPRAVKTTA
jgi:CBS domain-containing protein